jgi:hypothetical protein
METRRIFIERTLRQIYGGQPSDDATITINLVNLWLEQGIALAAKANYKDSLTIDGVGYINNSFYTTFKLLAIEDDGNFLWKISLPQIPFGIGNVDGISTVEIQDNASPQTSYPILMLSENQRSFSRGMRPIPNKLLGYPEGEFVYIQSTLILNGYTARVTMVSGGDSTDLDSTLNVPSDYFPVIVEYIKQQLMFERMAPVDLQNDGQDFVKST